MVEVLPFILSVKIREFAKGKTRFLHLPKSIRKSCEFFKCISCDFETENIVFYQTSKEIILPDNKTVEA